MRPAELVRLLPLGALVVAGCPGPASPPADRERHRAPPLDEGSAATESGAGAETAAPSSASSGTPAHVACGAASCSGGSCGGD